MKHSRTALAFLSVLIICTACQNPVQDTPKKKTKALTSFGFENPVVSGTVSETAHTVDILVPRGTPVTALVPIIAHTGASIKPASGVAHDFSGPVTYTVTAENGSTQAYEVTCRVSELVATPRIGTSGIPVKGDGLTVTLTCDTPGAEIRYTVDGSDPAGSSKTYKVYASPFAVTESCALKAVAVFDGETSTVVSRDFVILDAPVAPELLVNGDFAHGDMLWQTMTHDGAQATWDYANGKNTVAIADGGPNCWSVHTMYFYIPLKKDEYYELSFDASSTVEREIEISINEGETDVDGDGNCYDGISYQYPTLTPTVARYVYRFKMGETTNPGVHLEFQMGKGLGTITLDNVSLKTIVPSLIPASAVPDAALRSALEAKTGTVFGTTLTDMTLDSLINLDVTGVANLTGMEYCHNLRNINMENSAVTSLDALSTLTSLERVALYDCGVDDIDAIASMPILAELQLIATMVMPFSWSIITRANFPKLRTLMLDGQALPPGTCSYDQVKGMLDDLTDMTSLGFSYFGITDAEFADMTAKLLSKDPSLEKLSIRDNGLTKASLPELAKLSTLSELNCKNNGLAVGAIRSELTVLKSLVEMRKLDAANIGLSAMTGALTNQILFLQDWYDEPGTHAFRTNGELGLAWNSIDYSNGTVNKTVADYLIGKGVKIDCVANSSDW